MKPTASLSRFDRVFNVVADRARDPALLFLRVVWGWMFFQTGLGKLMNLERTTEFFASLGLPMPFANALFVGTLELVGGLLLVGGLWGRKVAFLLLGNMVVAYLTAHTDAFGSLRAFTGAEPNAFLVASCVVFAFGPGRWSIDAWRQRSSRSENVTIAQSARA